MRVVRGVDIDSVSSSISSMTLPSPSSPTPIPVNPHHSPIPSRNLSSAMLTPSSIHAHKQQQNTSKPHNDEHRSTHVQSSLPPLSPQRTNYNANGKNSQSQQNSYQSYKNIPINADLKQATSKGKIMDQLMKLKSS